MSFLSKITKKVSLFIFVALATALMSAVVTNVVTNDSILEYRTAFQDKYFEIPGKAAEELEIHHKGRKIEDISVYDIYIYNRLGWVKEPENVQVFFEISQKENKPIPKLIKPKLYPPSSLPQEIGIREEKQSKKNLYAFKIGVIKKTDRKDPYIARFIFEGTETPNVKVTPLPLNANVRIIPYLDWVDNIILITIPLAMVLGFSIGYLIGLILNELFFWEKRWPEMKSRLENVLNRTKNLNLDKNEVDLITDEYKKEFKPTAIMQLIQGKKSNDDKLDN